MRKLSFLALAAVGLLFGACASNDAVDEKVKESRSEGYMAIKINLPTTPVTVTRAANDIYDDGETYEYNVQDCALLFFEGTEEASAKLITAQNVLLPFTPNHTDNDNDNVTYSFTATSKISGFSGGSNNLYALALLNYRNVMSLGGDGTPTVGGTPLVLKSTKFSDFVELLANTSVEKMINNGATDNNYFFMSNAVLSTAVGGHGVSTAPTKDDLQQLATLDPDKIKDTEAEARADAAGEIFVERAVAKVTITVPSSVKTIETGIGTPLTITSVDGWTLDNMEPNSFVTKNTGFLRTTPETDYIPYTSGAFASKNYRMVGNTSVRVDGTKTNPYLDASPDLYRSYWCVDPHYNADVSAGVMDGGTTFVGMDKAMYCFENTFDTQRQSYKNTTRAIFKVTTNGGDFFTVNEDQTTYKEADATSYVKDNVVNNSDVLLAFKHGLESGKSYTVKKESFNFTFTRDDETGRYKLTGLTLSTDVTNAITAGTFKSTFASDIAATLTAAKTAANTNVILRSYKDGEMWYEARIQHFADPNSQGYTSGTFDARDSDLAPWNKWETSDKPTGGSTSGSYPGTDAEKNYLGRYGLVRNNWYDIEVTGIKRLGKPVDPSNKINNPEVDYPDTPDTPDDDLSQYISAKIHVLSWAKRTQKWTL
jgi:hypothetical protein